MMSERVAIFPGSFDPFTVGHENIVYRGLSLFDRIVISIGYNANKSGCFSLEQREEWIRGVFVDESRVSVERYSGLTVDFAKSVGAQSILRGLRTSADFEFERAIAQANKQMSNIDTVFLQYFGEAPEPFSIASYVIVFPYVVYGN